MNIKKLKKPFGRILAIMALVPVLSLAVFLIRPRTYPVIGVLSFIDDKPISHVTEQSFREVFGSVALMSEYSVKSHCSGVWGFSDAEVWNISFIPSEDYRGSLDSLCCEAGSIWRRARGHYFSRHEEDPRPCYRAFSEETSNGRRSVCLMMEIHPDEGTATLALLTDR
ncbi:MAG: hypothetical protein IJL91_04700 [Bacteroidales bacterium]|nr:hypothetical protein [Bacteroidales bacterium]